MTGKCTSIYKPRPDRLRSIDRPAMILFAILLFVAFHWVMEQSDWAWHRCEARQWMSKHAMDASRLSPRDLLMTSELCQQLPKVPFGLWLVGEEPLRSAYLNRTGMSEADMENVANVRRLFPEARIIAFEEN